MFKDVLPFLKFHLHIIVNSTPEQRYTYTFHGLCTSWKRAQNQYLAGSKIYDLNIYKPLSDMEIENKF